MYDVRIYVMNNSLHVLRKYDEKKVEEKKTAKRKTACDCVIYTITKFHHKKNNVKLIRHS